MTLLEVARIIFALIAVIGMIGLAAVAAKKLGLDNRGTLGGMRKRLHLVEAMPLDQKRRAVILKCDGREHLLILNANAVTVVERDIPPANVGEINKAIKPDASPNPFGQMLARFAPTSEQKLVEALRSSDEKGEAA